jgi:hypothetical protein
VSGKSLKITGNGTLEATADGVAAYVFDGFLDIECDEIFCENGISFYCSGSTSISYVKATKILTFNNGTPVLFEDGECYITSSYIGDSAVDDSRSAYGANYNAAILTTGSTTGTFIVNADKIRIRAYGYTIFNTGVKFMQINAAEILNEYTSSELNDELCAVIADNAVQNDFCEWNANVFGSYAVNGYYIKSINEVDPGFLGVHRFNGTITVDYAVAIWANGNFDINLYMNGVFTNNTDETGTIRLGGGIGEWANSSLKLFVTGKVINNTQGGIGLQYYSLGTLRANLSKLIVDAIMISKNAIGTSIQGDDSDVPLDVIIYRLISNVSSSPDTINETVVQSVVDPTVI